jgi:hypothetical protein
MPTTKIIIDKPTTEILLHYPRLIKKAASVSDKQVGRELITTAQVIYLKQRKTTNPSPINSAILNSFRYELLEDSDTRIVSQVSAGGQDAPYAIYVEMGHTLRNGKWWEGYHFLDFDSSNWQTVGGLPAGYFRVRVNEIYSTNISGSLTAGV